MNERLKLYTFDIGGILKGPVVQKFYWPFCSSGYSNYD